MEPAKTLSPENLSFGMLAGHAWRSLKGSRGLSIGALLLTGLLGLMLNVVLLLVMFVVSRLLFQGNAEMAGVAFEALSRLTDLISGFLLAPMNVGFMFLFFLTAVRGEKPSLEMIFKPYSQFGRYVWAGIRIFIFIFLWSLLLFIPGIIAMLRYFMTYYVLLDHPEYSVKQAMEESSAIIYGYKWRMVGYDLLWVLIAVPIIVFTLGIGLLWLVPWMHAFNAAFYETLRRGPQPAETPAEPVAEPAN